MANSLNICIASPREPSGVAWLVNCFLELDIKTYVISENRMWQREGECYYLKPSAKKYQKWIPSLLDRNSFTFKKPYEAVWMHEFPSQDISYDKYILFIRDPRDAFYSRYKRENPPISFDVYLEQKEDDTAQDRVSTWCSFVSRWLDISDIHVCKFEDYKSAPYETLEKTLDYLGYTASKSEIKRAISLSTFEKAREAERKIASRDNEKRIMNRAGKAGEWRELTLAEDIRGLQHIISLTQPWLNKLGYELD